MLFWYRGVFLKFWLKSHLLLFFRQKQLKRECTSRKKRYFFSKLSLWYRGVSINFVKSLTLHFIKIVSLVQVVFLNLKYCLKPQLWVIFRQKTTEKDCVPGGKTLHFVEFATLLQGSFAEILYKISAFVLFSTKTT